MAIPGIFKLGRVSIMLQIWHLAFMHFLLLANVGVVGFLTWRALA